MAKILGGAPLLPVAVLAGLNLVDEFDRIAFAALAPEIRDSFAVSDGAIGTISTLSQVVILAIAIPVGRLADRHRRLTIAAVSALLWGVMSVLTGLVTTVALLVVVRILAGIGRNANEIVHPSVITDLYPPDAQPRAFQIHRMANPAGQISGVIAGFIASLFSWQAAFIVLSLPTFVLLIMLRWLVEEPPRRDPDGRAARGSPVRFTEAFGFLISIDSIKRFMATAFFLGGATTTAFVLISLFFEDIHNYGPIGRGLVQFVLGAGWFIGVIAGGQLAARRVAELRYERMVVDVAIGLSFIAVGSAALVVSPNPAVSLAATFLAASGNGIWQAGYFSAVGRIVPGHLTGQAFGYTTLFFGLGSIATIPLFFLPNERLGFVGVTVFGAIATFFAFTVSKVIRADLDRCLDPG